MRAKHSERKEIEPRGKERGADERKEWVNSFWGLKLKQLNDPNYLNKPNRFELDTSSCTERCGRRRRAAGEAH